MELYKDITLTQVRTDWKYLDEKYGHPYDFCGAFCEESAFTDILLGKAKVKDTIISLITYYFTKPKQRNQIDFSDERIVEIMERYYIE